MICFFIKSEQDINKNQFFVIWIMPQQWGMYTSPMSNPSIYHFYFLFLLKNQIKNFREYCCASPHPSISPIISIFGISSLALYSPFPSSPILLLGDQNISKLNNKNTNFFCLTIYVQLTIPLRCPLHNIHNLHNLIHQIIFLSPW